MAAKKLKNETGKQWGGRFSSETNKVVEAFTESISFDWRLYLEDIQVNTAYAKALTKIAIFTEAELKKITAALENIASLIEEKKADLNPELEDIHTLIESLLIKKVGDSAKKIHTGRSRNDQVATDVRLFSKTHIGVDLELITRLQKTLIESAEKYFGAIMPGFTHLQSAQPVLISHYLLAYFEMFERDLQRLAFAYDQTDVMPLGSAALAGSAYPIDRDFLAKELGFSRITQNSLDAVSDRDFILDYLYALSVLFMHLSRFSEDLIIYSSSEFNFVEMSDAFATGSSIMPQKKNPDVAELTRAKAAKMQGLLTGMYTLLKGLPLAYNRDLQDDKTFLFSAVDISHITILVFTQMLAGLKFNTEHLLFKSDKNFLTATDLADYLALKKIPFREAHHLVGQIVSYSLKHKKELSELSLDEFKSFSKLIEKDIYALLSPEGSVSRRNVVGGTAPKQVLAAIKKNKLKYKGN
jgi:argininosuccinate lyase